MTPAIATCLVVLGLAAPAPRPEPATPPASTPREGTAPTGPSDTKVTPPATGATSPNADEAAPKSDQVTRYSFTGLDIDGELRTPALLQFLARIAGEFETLGIPHRSFMPELRATAFEDAL
jgi:hypothetical protein